MKLVCQNCGQIYTMDLEKGFTNAHYKLAKSSEVLDDDDRLFSDVMFQKRVCGNCYNQDFMIYF